MGKTWRKERSDWDDHHSKKGFVKRQKNFWREEEVEEEIAHHEETDEDFEIENINNDTPIRG